MIKLEKDIIENKLSRNIFNNVTVFNTVVSTNTVARNYNCGSVILAEEQSKGRGRQGKSFLSKKGGLYMSIVLSPNNIKSVQLTTAIAVAVSDAIDSLTGKNTQIKWVNDIFYKGKKVAGILTELFQDKIIIGIGINVYPVDLGELNEIATYLCHETDIFDINKLAIQVLTNIDKILKLKPKDYMDNYRQKSNVLGKEIFYYVNNVKCCGRVINITDEGTLIVEDKNEETEIISGEITIKII